jgi:tetratricopeptide (TPR) repeat protein
MSHHPTREVLEGFLRGSLSTREARTVVAHLVVGCAECREIMAPMAAGLFAPALEEEARLTPEIDAAYEQAITSGIATALSRSAVSERERERGAAGIPAAAGERIAAIADLSNPQSCEDLLERSYAVRLSDPDTMLRLAEMAALAAEGLDVEVYGPTRIGDLQCRAWAEVANAYRVNGDLLKADRAMARAVDCRLRGTGDRRLLARLSDLAASLACAQRRFDDAFRLLDMAYSLYRDLGDNHAAGRILIARGLYAGYTGAPDDGIRFLVQGLTTIDRSREPKLAFQALHNIVLLRVELGEYEAARQTLLQMRPLYDRYLSSLERVKLRWVEGKIAVGLGELDTAEESFLAARQQFDEAGLGYRAALASLDLAGAWLRQGKTAQVRGLVAELFATFQAVGVEREAIVGILLLRDAVECEQATLELLELIATSLGRLDRRTAPPPDPEPR